MHYYYYCTFNTNANKATTMGEARMSKDAGAAIHWRLARHRGGFRPPPTDVTLDNGIDARVLRIGHDPPWEQSGLARRLVAGYARLHDASTGYKCRRCHGDEAQGSEEQASLAPTT